MADTNDLSGIKVMVIDDSNTIRRSAEIFLKQAGCEIILAEDGFDALAKITDRQPDIIFVDVMMPRLDGYQTCSLIKKIVDSKPHLSSCYPAKMAYLIKREGALLAPMNISPSPLPKTAYSPPYNVMPILALTLLINKEHHDSPQSTHC